VIRKSVEYAFANTSDVMPYVKAHAQEMSEEVMKKHIDLYVNEYSIDLGETGSKAVKLLLNKAIEVGLIKGVSEPILIN
jgi:1,4-dihydroxy-6-naphthoate synthase